MFQPKVIASKIMVNILIPQFSGMTEYYFPIPGFESRYQVSNFGNVKSLSSASRKSDKVMSPGKAKGYQMVYLYKNGSRTKYYVHRLVASVFIPNLNNHPVVNHLDGDPLNNNLNNLEWCTQRHNLVHSVPNRSKLTADEVIAIRELSSQGISNVDIANQFSLHPGSVSNIVLGNRWASL